MPGQMLQASLPTSQDCAAFLVHKDTAHQGLVSARRTERQFPILLRQTLDVLCRASTMDIRAYAHSRALESIVLRMLAPQAVDELRE